MPLEAIENRRVLVIDIACKGGSRLLTNKIITTMVVVCQMFFVDIRKYFLYYPICLDEIENIWTF